MFENEELTNDISETDSIDTNLQPLSETLKEQWVQQFENELQQIRNIDNNEKNLEQRSSQIDVQIDSIDPDESYLIDELINKEKEKFLQNKKLRHPKDTTTTEVTSHLRDILTAQPGVLENNISDITLTDQSETISPTQLNFPRNTIETLHYT